MHTVLIALHAIAGGVAFLTGWLAHRHRVVFGAHVWSLVAMVVFLAAAIAAEWAVIDMATRVLFAALTVLGGALPVVVVRAGRHRVDGSRRQPVAYVQAMGFTLVALFDAFIVIAVLNAGAPGYAVVGSGVLGAVVGHVGIRVARSRAAGVDGRSVGIGARVRSAP